MNRTLLRALRSQPHASSRTGAGIRISSSVAHLLRYYCTTVTESLLRDGNDATNNKRGKWLTLPRYTSVAAAFDGSALGKKLASTAAAASQSAAETTALKWVLRCCPELPRNLVQKLFRLRQVRIEESSDLGSQSQECRVKRVAAKYSMKLGDRIFLPGSVQVLPIEKQEPLSCSEEEVNFIRGLELYKDDAIIVVNKPPGLPVQGGIGIKRSLDEMSAACLTYDYPEPPRLVHRLDRDSSGVLVMGRTQTSATVLHSIFREKTFSASTDGVDKQKRILQRRYWALVIGCPRRPEGLITAPLRKVVMDNGKSERITVVDNGKEDMSSQHAVTKYRVIGLPSHGYAWLELSPLTGRKHQLRVHCAEVLGTPIVGDYKYGWQAHRKWKPFPLSNPSGELYPDEKLLPFGLDLESGSISEKQPRLHLHCKHMVLPNVSQALQGTQSSLNYDLSQVERLNLDAPLPSYMKRSWDFLSR